MGLRHFSLAWIALSALSSGLLVRLALNYRACLQRAEAEPEVTYAPKISVIVPCNGVDHGFRRFLDVLLDQEYPNYEIVFVTADRHDPAYAQLRKRVNRFPCRARLTTAGIANGRAQKVHNQLAALEIADQGSEAYVFVDSDGCPDRQLLRHLMAALAQDGVGASTGYRWFVPAQGRLLEVLIALWGAIVASVQATPPFTQLWGGAMAIRRETFRALDGTQVWSGAGTDDDALTRALHQHGLRIAFAPRCAVVSTVDYSMGEFMAWGTRQVLLTRVYLPQVWCQLFTMTAMTALAPVVGLMLICLALAGSGHNLPLGLALTASALAPVVSTAVIARSTEAFLTGSGRSVPRLGNWAFLAAPPGTLFLLAHFVCSGVTRRAVWRGVTYDLLAPDRTVVVRKR